MFHRGRRALVEGAQCGRSRGLGVLAARARVPTGRGGARVELPHQVFLRTGYAPGLDVAAAHNGEKVVRRAQRTTTVRDLVRERQHDGCVPRRRRVGKEDRAHERSRRRLNGQDLLDSGLLMPRRIEGDAHSDGAGADRNTGRSPLLSIIAASNGCAVCKRRSAASTSVSDTTRPHSMASENCTGLRCMYRSMMRSNAPSGRNSRPDTTVFIEDPFIGAVRGLCCATGEFSIWRRAGSLGSRGGGCGIHRLHRIPVATHSRPCPRGRVKVISGVILREILTEAPTTGNRLTIASATASSTRVTRVKEAHSVPAARWTSDTTRTRQ